MESFYYTDIQDWNGQDCLGWATKTCMQLGLKFYEVDFEAFGFLSGKDLLHFTETDFCRKIDKIHGPKFYESFQSFSEFCERNNSEPKNKVEVSYRRNEDHSYDNSKCNETWSRTWHHILENSAEISEGCPNNYSSHNSIIKERSQHSLPPTETSTFFLNSCPSSYQESVSEEDSSASTESLYPCNRNCKIYSIPYVEDDSWDSVDQQNAGYNCTHEQNSESSPCHTLSSAESKEKKWKQKIKNKTRPKRVRDPFVWEFLLMLLQDKDFNPTHIRWEDQRKGTFKLIQKEEIAKEWGERTEKHKQAPLSYGHFSRSLRYHYTSGYLLPVSEKHLVYKFGPKVMEWLANDMKTQI